MVAIRELVTVHKTPEEKSDIETTIGCIGLGVPMLVAGGWIMWGMQKQQRQDASDRRKSNLLSISAAIKGIC